jgi:hypothetical protein
MKEDGKLHFDFLFWFFTFECGTSTAEAQSISELLI